VSNNRPSIYVPIGHPDNVLGKKVVAKTATIPSIEHDDGEVIGYCTAPQVLIKRKDGTQFWWRYDLCAFEGEKQEGDS